MGATYTRQSSYSDGDTITAAHTNDEFNQLLAAFASSSGHTHDGTSAEGGPITKLLGNAITLGAGTSGTDVTITFDGESADGILYWMEDEDYFKFADDVLINSTEKLYFNDTGTYIYSNADGDLDLVSDGTNADAISLASAGGITLDAAADISLDVGGADVVLKDDGTTFGALTQSGGELVIKSGSSSTTAMTLSGANVTFAGTVTIGSAGISEAELEILDGATVTTAELNILDGVTATTAELNYSDTGSAVGTVVASKVVTADANKDVASFRNVTLTGELDAATLDISGNADIDGTTNLDAVDIDGVVQIDGATTFGVDDTGVDVKFFGATASAYLLWDESADKLLTAGGAVIDIVKDKLLIGGTAVTTTAAELNVLDAVTAGTVTASLAVVVDSNKDIGSFRNITLTGELDAGSLDVSGNADIDGTLEADAITVDGTALSTYIRDTVGTNMVSSNTESGITVTYDTTNDNIDFAIDAAQTGITSLLATDIKIGEDDQTKIDFETADEIHFYAANVHQVKLVDNAFTPQADSDVDLGASGTYWKDAYIDSITTTGNVAVGGTLTVNGTTTTVNSTTVTVDDPIFTLGGDTAPGSDDNKDRGIEFRYHTGSAAKVGFFGYDDSASVFTFIADATNSSEVFSGTAGNVAFGNVAGTLTTAAQANVTSLGTLTTLTVDNVIVNGATIGHTDDTDLITLADGIATVAGEISVTTLDIGGTNVTSTAAELNILDGVTSTSTELNIMDGGTAASAITLADADRFVTNDDGTMKQVALTTLKTYLTSAGFSSDDPTALAIALG